MRFLQRFKQRTEERRLQLLQQLLAPNAPVAPVFPGRIVNQSIDRQVEKYAMVLEPTRDISDLMPDDEYQRLLDLQ